MPMILLFQRGGDLLSLSEISQGLSELLGLTCSVYAGEKKVAIQDYKDATAEFHEGRIYVEIPDLESDEGIPAVTIEAAPRLDRDESVQKMIDEILTQDDSLEAELNQNKRDVVITYEDTPAATEAGYALAYTLSSETGSGILMPASAEDEGTLWFDDAEDFADQVFGDDDDEGGEEDDEEEVDAEDEEK